MLNNAKKEVESYKREQRSQERQETSCMDRLPKTAVSKKNSTPHQKPLQILKAL